MLTRIVLENFQCHRKLSLEFDKLTTLVGPSDSGKTAILRAIDWVCFNRGRTALLLRRGAEDVSVSLTVDLHEVVRSTHGNSYILDGSIFTAIGRNVPIEASSILKMTDDNVQRQHDYLFWFTDTGSGLVSNLNRVVDMTKLERWVKSGISQERHFKERESYLTTRRTELESEYTTLQPYEEVDVELQELESLHSTVLDSSQLLNQLSTIVDDLTSTNNRVETLHGYCIDLAQLLGQCEDVVGVIDTMHSLHRVLAELEAAGIRTAACRHVCDYTVDFAELFGLRNRHIQLVQCLESLDVVSSNALSAFCIDLQSMLTDGAEVMSLTSRLMGLSGPLKLLEQQYPDPSPILGALVALQQQIELSIGLSHRAKEYDSLKDSMEQKRLALAVVASEYEEKLGGICPVCGQEMEDKDWNTHC